MLLVDNRHIQVPWRGKNIAGLERGVANGRASRGSVER